jgi:anthranilate 1,2-dioxygenase small subunit/terephthalate 1,2-dioxygenase oxygenase component beta subunit
MQMTEAVLRLVMLNTAYAAAIDADRLEEWPDFFTEDCLYRITTAENHRQGLQAGVIYADSRAMLHDRIFALRRANIYERQSYRHIIGMPAISGQDDNGFRAEASFLVVRTMRDGKMEIFAAGRYLDAVRHHRDGTLRLAERQVVCDSPNFDTLLAIPL